MLLGAGEHITVLLAVTHVAVTDWVEEDHQAVVRVTDIVEYKAKSPLPNRE